MEAHNFLIPCTRLEWLQLKARADGFEFRICHDTTSAPSIISPLQHLSLIGFDRDAIIGESTEVVIHQIINSNLTNVTVLEHNRTTISHNCQL